MEKTTVTNQTLCKFITLSLGKLDVHLSETTSVLQLQISKFKMDEFKHNLIKMYATSIDVIFMSFKRVLFKK